MYRVKNTGHSVLPSVAEWNSAAQCSHDVVADAFLELPGEYSSLPSAPTSTVKLPGKHSPHKSEPAAADCADAVTILSNNFQINALEESAVPIRIEICLPILIEMPVSQTVPVNG